MFRHSSLVYLIKSGTLKSFGTIMFGTKYISAAQIGSNIAFLSTTLNLSSIADQLSWFTGPVDL